MDIQLREVMDAASLGVETASPFCLKAHRTLRAAGLPYTRVYAPMPSAQKGPTGQVPVLMVDGRELADSTAIARWVVRQTDRIDAGPEQWLWEELADTALNGFLVAARWADDDNWQRIKLHYFARMPAFLRWFLPGRIRAGVVRALVARDVWRAGPKACWDRFAQLLDDLDARAPAEGFWLGARLGVGDIAMYAQLRSLCTSLTPAQGDAVRARPRLYAWLMRVDAATASPELRLAA